jgi:hypothetical protein
MIQVVKIIGTGIATTGLIGAGIGIVFGDLILGAARNILILLKENTSSLISQTFSFFLPILALPYLLLSGDNNNGENAQTREELEQELSELHEEREIINDAHSKAGDNDDESAEELLGEMLETIDKRIDTLIELINDIINNN